MPKFERRTDNKLLTGVCSGIADYFHWDVNLVRLVTVAATLATGVWPGVLAYAIAWTAMPERGTGKLGFDTLKKTYDEKLKPTVDEKIKPTYDEKFKSTVDEKIKPFYNENIKPTVDKAAGKAQDATTTTYSPTTTAEHDATTQAGTAEWEKPYDGARVDSFDENTTTGQTHHDAFGENATDPFGDKPFGSDHDHFGHDGQQH